MNKRCAHFNGLVTAQGLRRHGDPWFIRAMRIRDKANLSVKRRIFAGVIVHIFPHKHAT